MPLDAPSPTVAADGICGVPSHKAWIEFDGMADSADGDAVSKPPYRVPTMAEIAAIPPNGLVVASTFSGCGGSCLGYRMAGFEVRWANEFVGAARDSYRPNHPGTVLDIRDIRDVQPDEVLDALGMAPGELDLFDGSPPCQSFSTSGSRQRGWGQVSSHADGSTQRSDDLFFEYARLVDGIRPRAFIAENVSGLVKGVAKGYFMEIHARLAACGYLVEARLLDAQWLGVPQMRQRIIFQGVRADLAEAGVRPAWPVPLPYRYTLSDALPWLSGRRVVLPGHGYFGGAVRDADTLPSSTIGTMGVAGSVSYHLDHAGGIETDPETGYRVTLDGTALGALYDKTPEGASNGRRLNLKRAGRDRPSFTVVAGAAARGTASVTHPTERRKFTLLELRRICGFPDDFELSGTYQERWARLGNSVPPPMMRAVAEAVRDGVLLPARPAP